MPTASLYALSSYAGAFGPVERIPVGEVAARSGQSVDWIRRLLLAQGLPVDETTLLPAHAVDDAAAFELGMSLFGEEATLAFTRVMGASVARIVDAAISLFYGEVSPTLSDATELERARTNERAGAVFAVVPMVIAHSAGAVLPAELGAGAVDAGRRRGSDRHRGHRLRGPGGVDRLGRTPEPQGPRPWLCRASSRPPGTSPPPTGDGW